MFLCSGSIFSFLDDNNLPFNLIDPLSIFSNPAIVLSIVVFPMPDGPRIHKVSPSFSMLKEAFLTLVLPPMVKSTFLISKKFLICLVFFLILLEFPL